MKILLKILAGLVVLLVIAVVALILFLNKAVLTAVNEAGPAALGVPVTLKQADIRPFRGKMSLSGFHLGNPEGFKTDGLLDLGSIRIRVDLGSLKTDTIIVREIAIDGLVLTYEKGLRNSNLGALIDQLSAGKEEEPSGQEKPEEPPAGEEKPAKKVIIEKLSITGSRMNFSFTGAAALTGGGAIPIHLPPITLTDLGKESDGLTLTEAIEKILNAIAEVATSAISGAGKLLGTGAGAVGEGAADAGKAVVDTAADAGKALGNAASDAGKAVGDALKNIHPFGK